MKSKRLLSFVGTRPELIKNLALSRAAANFPELDFVICHTGQNFGDKMADGIADELRIPVAVRNDSVDRSSFGSVAKSIMEFVEVQLKRYSPDIVISNTDTDTAFYAALTSAKLKKDVAHIEGGIRCEARSNPEEINRRLSDHLSRWIFTISETDSQSLLMEGFPPESIFMCGDITVDALRIVLDELDIKVTEGNYDLMTIHRQENAGSPERLKVILEAVEESGFKTIFPVHPRTKEALAKSGLWKTFANSKIIHFMEPQTFVEMVKVLAGSRKVISDSGGLRREAYVLEKPVISLAEFVWFREMNLLGYEYVAGADNVKLMEGIRNYNPPKSRPPLFGDGQAAVRILKILMESE